MAVTHTTVGFTGTVDQTGEAQRMARLGPRGTVASSAAWLVSVATGDRKLSVAAGSGQACGTTDTTTATDSVTLDAHAAASSVYRYDLIVARWKWTDPLTPVAFVYLTGVSGASGPDLTKLVRTPGVQYDLPLAVVRVAGGQGQLTANDVFDCRGWNTGSGPLHVANAHAYLLSTIDTTEIIDLATRRHYRKISGLWWKHGGNDLLIYDNANLTASGLVGAGQTANIVTIPLTSPVGSDCGLLDMEVAMQAGAGTSVGYVRVTIGGVVVRKIYNIPTSPVPIHIVVPFSCLAGALTLVLDVEGSSGEASFVNFSSARVTV